MLSEKIGVLNGTFPSHWGGTLEGTAFVSFVYRFPGKVHVVYTIKLLIKN